MTLHVAVCHYFKTFLNTIQQYAKSVRIRSYSGPYFPAFGMNTDRNNSEYGHLLHSEKKQSMSLIKLDLA